MFVKTLHCSEIRNEILRSGEHSNYVASSPSSGMLEFRDVVAYCSLLDLGYHGSQFTWSNKQQEGIICKKLDRMLVNEKWIDDNPHSYCVFESGGCSDHLRSRFYRDNRRMERKKPFKFVNVLTTLPQFEETVGEFWEKTEPLFVSTSAIYRLSKKLKAIKLTIRELSREKIGKSFKAHKGYL